MAWEKANKIFPFGYADLPDGNYIPNNLLKDSKIKTIYKDVDRFARHMIISTERYVWGDEGEFAIVAPYDVYNCTRHVDFNYLPLSVYGQSMVNSYLAINGDI